MNRSEGNRAGATCFVETSGLLLWATGRPGTRWPLSSEISPQARRSAGLRHPEWSRVRTSNGNILEKNLAHRQSVLRIRSRWRASEPSDGQRGPQHGAEGFNVTRSDDNTFSMNQSLDNGGLVHLTGSAERASGEQQHAERGSGFMVELGSTGTSSPATLRWTTPLSGGSDSTVQPTTTCCLGTWRAATSGASSSSPHPTGTPLRRTLPQAMHLPASSSRTRVRSILSGNVAKTNGERGFLLQHASTNVLRGNNANGNGWRESSYLARMTTYSLRTSQ